MSEQVVLVTGVFDLLHAEHRNFLQKAKALGGKLLVGVESDVRVRALKGEGRPINSQAVRVANITALGIADEVFVLPEAFSKPEHHRTLLEQLRPNILAVSSHSPHLDKKQQLMESLGGQVVIVHQHNPSVSTTQILQQKEIQHG